MYRSLLSPISLLDNRADPSSEEVDEADTLDVDVTGTLELRRPKGLWDHESICPAVCCKKDEMESKYVAKWFHNK